jgi:glutamyl/glutaminyl-tRNA synthetase
VANRRFAEEHGGALLLRIDDTDAARNVVGGADAIVADLEWLGVPWDDGPVRQSERAERHREAAETIGERDGEGALRFRRTTLVRQDGSPTYQLATAVDDVDFRITHVIRGSDHRANAELQAELIRALGAEPPEYIHHGLLLGEDGHKLSKRHGASSLADLREGGIPPEAVRAYLEELGIPRHDVHLDLARLRRLSTDLIGSLGDDELAARVGVPVSVVPVLRGARDLSEAREYARHVLEPEPAVVDAPETLERFRELVEGGIDPRGIVRELKAVGASLKAVRLALTGRERGPELAAVIAALPREELLRRVDA